MGENSNDIILGMAQDLLTEATGSESPFDQKEYLSQAAELIFQTKSSELIQQLLPVILSFHASPFPLIRTTLLDILDDVCKHDLVAFFPHIVPILEALIEDPSESVSRRVIQSSAVLYRKALTHVWLSPPSSADPWAAAWSSMQRLKERIVNSLEAFNRSLLQLRILKFIQMLAMAFSDDHHNLSPDDDPLSPDPSAPLSDDSSPGSRRFRLDAIPALHPILSRPGLKAEGERFALRLVGALEGDHIVVTTPALLVHLHLVAALGRRRTCFLPSVVDALLAAHASKGRLLASMTRHQVRSIEYAIRATLIAMLRVPGVATTWGEAFIESLAQVGAEDAARRIFRQLGDQVDLEADRKRSRADIENQPGSSSSTALFSSSSSSSSSAFPNHLQPSSMQQHPSSSLSQPQPGASQAHFQAAKRMRVVPPDVDTAFLSRFMALGLGPLHTSPVHGWATPAAIVHFLINNMANLPPPPTTQLRDRLAAKEAALLSTDPRLAALQLAQQRQTRSSAVATASSVPHAPRRRDAPQQALPALRGKLVVPTFSIEPASVTVASALSLGAASFSRVIRAYPQLQQAGQLALWAAVVTPLALQWPFDHPVTQLLVDHLTLNYPSSVLPLTSWLTREYVEFKRSVAALSSTSISSTSTSTSTSTSSFTSTDFIKIKKELPDDGDDDDDGDGDPSDATATSLALSERYDKLASLILRRITPTVDPRTSTFQELICGLPHLPPFVFQLLGNFCREYARVSIGLQTLSELILHRPKIAATALACMLEQSTQEDTQLRTAVVRSLTQLAAQLADDAATIEAYAIQSLKQLISPELVAMTDAKQTDAATARFLQLFLTLCLGKPSLLLLLCSTYAEAPQHINKAIRMQINEVVHRLPAEDSIWLEILKSFPEGSKMLVLHILHVRYARILPPPQVVATIKERHSDDPHFLLPILPALDKTELVLFLPLIIARLRPPAVKTGLDRLLNPSLHSPITPRELLFELCLLKSAKNPSGESIPSENMKSTIHECLHSIVYSFSSEDVATVLSQLANLSPPPPLLIYLITETITQFPAMTMGFRMGILTQLIRKQIWQDPELWLEFIHCCEVCQPDSYDILVNLPLSWFQDALSKSPQLLTSLKLLIQQQPLRFQQSILDTIRNSNLVESV